MQALHVDGSAKPLSVIVSLSRCPLNLFRKIRKSALAGRR